MVFNLKGMDVGIYTTKEHVGHVSMSVELHIEHIMDGKEMGPKNSFLRALPIY